MRRLLALLAVLAWATPASATRYGPDYWPYVGWDTTYTYSFEDISGTGTRILSGTDNAAVTVTLPFDFKYYGLLSDELEVSTTGVIAVGGRHSSGTNPPIATAGDKTNDPYPDVRMMDVLWDDWHFIPNNDGAGCCADADGVYWQVIGTKPNRRVVIQGNKAYGVTGPPPSVTFEAILFETTNKVVFQYSDVTSGDARDAGATATVGIRSWRSITAKNATDVTHCLEGSIAQFHYHSGYRIQVSYNGTVPITSGLALEFWPADVHLGYPIGGSHGQSADTPSCFYGEFSDTAAMCTANCKSVYANSRRDITGLSVAQNFDPTDGLYNLTGADTLGPSCSTGFAGDSVGAQQCVPSQITTELFDLISGPDPFFRFDLETAIPIPYAGICAQYRIGDVAVDEDDHYWVWAAPMSWDFTLPNCEDSLTTADWGIFEFSDTGTLLSRFNAGSSATHSGYGLAYDPTTDHLFLSENISPTKVYEYTKAGVLTNTFTISASVPAAWNGGGSGLDVNPLNDRFWITGNILNPDTTWASDPYVFEFERDFSTITAIYPFRDCARANIESIAWQPDGENFYNYRHHTVFANKDACISFMPIVPDQTIGAVQEIPGHRPSCQQHTTTTIPPDFEDITATGVRTKDFSTDDLPMPFLFEMYGTAYNLVSFDWAGGIGFVFGSPSPVFHHDLTIQVADFGDDPFLLTDAILPYGSYMLFEEPTTDAMYYETRGAAPNRSFIVQWNDACLMDDEFDFYPCTAAQNVTFEAKLFEGSNAIEFHYLDVDTGNTGSGDGGGASATIGLAARSGNLICNRESQPDGCEWDCSSVQSPASCGRVDQYSFDTPGAVSADAGLRFIPSETAGCEPTLPNAPRTCQHYAMTAIPVAFEDISATGTRVLAGSDSGITTLTYEFPFYLYGSREVQLRFGPDGVIGFLVFSSSPPTNLNFTDTDSSGFTFPDADFSDIFYVAPYWDSMRFVGTNTDAAYYQTKGDAPNRRLVIQWNKVCPSAANCTTDATAPVTFQAVFYETSNNIEFHYTDTKI